MHAQYEMIPCSGFIEEVLSVDADADTDADDGRFSARISHPPPFRRVTKNYDISYVVRTLVKYDISK